MLHDTQNTVNLAPATRERLTAPNFTSGAEQVGHALEGLGQGISSAEDTLDKLGEEYDTAAVKQADAEDLTKLTAVRASVLSSKGFDTQQAISDARQQIAQIRKDRIASLNNNRQRRMYADVFDQRNIGMEESFATHSASQIAEANLKASSDRADASADAAVDSFGSPEFQGNLDTAVAETAAVNKGQLPDVINRAQAKVRSSIYSRAIETMIADPDQADHANMALNQHASDILPEDEVKLRKLLNPILVENRTNADAGWAMSSDPKPQSGEQPPEHPSEAPTTEPRPTPNVAAPPPVTYKPVSPADPLRGKGRITDDAAAHRARGSGNALDIAAPAGTPIYTPMSGKVVKNWWDAKGGWSVLVEHPNGYVTGYAHMRAQSPYAVGQQVDSDAPIGSVGATGDATGPHVHYTVRQSEGGAKVDPSAALWNKQGTVNPNNVSWQEGEPQKFTADDNSLDRALQRLHDRAQSENWSTQRYNNAVDKVRQIASVQQQLYAKQEDDRYDQALQTVVNLGDKFTSVSQIPNFGLLKSERQYRLQQIALSNATGKGQVANGDRFLLLKGMELDPAMRNEFLSVDLGKETDITPAERAGLFEDQIKLRQEPNGALAVKLDTVNTYANRYLPKSKYSGPDGDSKRQQFSDRLAAIIERQQNTLNRPLTDREIDDSARSLTVQVVRPSGNKVMGFENMGTGIGGSVNVPDTFNTIAPDIRQQIADRLAAAGQSHTPRDVVRVWLQSRAR